MGHLSTFFNTEIQDSSFLSAIGDFGLTPVRYLFNGNKVLIKKDEQDNSTIEVHHVESFYHEKYHYSKSTAELESSTASMLKCIGMIIGLVPGFFLCIFKAFAYFSADTREDHRVAKLHFTPFDMTLGSKEAPAADKAALKLLFKEEKNKNKKLHRPVKTLTIHGNGFLSYGSSDRINKLNPEKVILAGIMIAKYEYENKHDDYILVELEKTKWQVINSATTDDAPTTLEEAQEFTPPRKGWFTFDRWRVLIEIPKPAAAT